MNFNVETINFEGPLDLMLHLIKDNKMDIFDLDMEILTDQYIEYLHKLEELELEVESEYLVELATLIEYKSKKLLPSKNDESLDDEDDPKERLVKRLLEYQKYKDASKKLYEYYEERKKELSKPLTLDKSFIKEENEKIEGDPYDLLKAMSRVLRRIRLSKPIDVSYTTKELSPEDRILQIKSRLINLPKTFSFDTLCEDCKELREYIVTFLAILDMAKDHYLTFSVDSDDNIWFERGTNNE